MHGTRVFILNSLKTVFPGVIINYYLQGYSIVVQFIIRHSLCDRCCTTIVYRTYPEVINK